MREAEQRVKNRQYEHDAMELGRELYADAQSLAGPTPEEWAALDANARGIEV
jgi:hypothetical protein